MTYKNLCFQFFCAGLLMAFWTGCRRPAVPPGAPAAARYQVRAAADPIINQGPDGQPLSVVVRLYQLRDRAAFAKLTFDLASSGRPDAELLDGEALGRDELVVVPGQDRTLLRDLLPGARYVGLVALFRHPDPQAWRYLVALEAMTPTPPPGPRDWPWRPWRRRPAAGRPTPTLSFRVRECALDRIAPVPETIPGQLPDSVPVCPGEAGSGHPGSGHPGLGPAAEPRP